MTCIPFSQGLGRGSSLIFTRSVVANAKLKSTMLPTTVIHDRGLGPPKSLSTLARGWLWRRNNPLEINGFQTKGSRT